jgi:flotillin
VEKKLGRGDGEPMKKTFRLLMAAMMIVEEIAVHNRRSKHSESFFKDESIGKAEALRDTRVKTSGSECDCRGKRGEDYRYQMEAACREGNEDESLRAAENHKVQSAKTLEESYVAGKSQRLSTCRRGVHRRMLILLFSEIAEAKSDY